MSASCNIFEWRQRSSSWLQALRIAKETAESTYLKNSITEEISNSASRGMTDPRTTVLVTMYGRLQNGSRRFALMEDG